MTAAKRFPSPVIACLGLAFKANIDDCRESPAVTIVKELAGKKTGDILVVEPNIRELPRALQQLDSVQLVDLAAAMTKADVIALLVDHKEFTAVDRRYVEGKAVIDIRGIWSYPNLAKG